MAEKELKHRNLKVSYDTKSDVIYFSFGEPREALSIESNQGMIVRWSPETKEVVGITIVDFSKKFAKNPGQVLDLSDKEICASLPNL